MILFDAALILLLIFGILTIVCVIILALTTGFKRSGRLSGGLYCLTAPPGNGKSYVATALAIMFMKQGRTVFSNYPIVYNNGREILETKVLEKWMLLDKNLNKSVLIIDEAHRWFWSRKFKEFTEEYKDFFSTISQHEISCYYIVQHEDRVDTIINDCANLFGLIEKTEVPLLDIPLCFTITWWERELDIQFARHSDRVAPFHIERLWFDKDIANAYDTKWFGGDRRPEYQGETWKEYLRREKGFEYQGTNIFSLKSQILKVMFEKIFKPVTSIMINMACKLRRLFPEMGKTFDREEKEDEQKLDEASGGAPVGGEPSIQKKDLSADEQAEMDAYYEAEHEQYNEERR